MTGFKANICISLIVGLIAGGCFRGSDDEYIQKKTRRVQKCVEYNKQLLQDNVTQFDETRLEALLKAKCIEAEDRGLVPHTGKYKLRLKLEIGDIKGDIEQL